VLRRRAGDLEKARASVVELTRHLRELVIGIWGNPNIAPIAKNRVDEKIAVAAAFGITLYLDSIFNATLLQYAASFEIAMAFSIAVSLAGSLFSYWSAATLKQLFNYRNAEAELEQAFRDTKGLDPATGKEARVFPTPREMKFYLWLNHICLAIICGGTVAIRFALSASWTDIVGSFGFIVVLLGLYAYEL
jgi:protein-S-isoprenylcysteine O-methyltransferase Ste14